jgi:cobalt-zinc-cadmium efflux system protein
MILIAILGIIVNGAAVLRLRGSKSFNAQAIAWHLLEDVLGWIAVFIVAVILLFTDAYILDPILSILVTLYVLFNVLKNLRKTLALFLQAVPENVSIESIQNRIQTIDQVESTHHIHVWSIDGLHHVLTSHVVVAETTTNEQVRCIKEEIRNLCSELDMTHSTIEIEFGEEHCSLAEEISR